MGPPTAARSWVAAQSMIEINPSSYRNLRWKRSDFIPVIKGIETPLVLVAHPSVPATTFDQWVDWARANRGKLSYANYGPGTISHFLGYQLDERFGLGYTQVPYRGNAPQMIDLLAGHALFGFTQLQSAVEPARAGSLRALVASGPKRSPLLPEVPTLADLGHADLTASAWFGLMLKCGHAGRYRQAAGSGRDRGARGRNGAGAARGPGLRGERGHRLGVRAEHRPAVRALGQGREDDRIFGDGVGEPRRAQARAARPRFFREWSRYRACVSVATPPRSESP